MIDNSIVCKAGFIFALAFQIVFGLNAQEAAPRPPTEPALGVLSRGDNETNAPVPVEMEDEPTTDSPKDIVKVGRDVVLKANETSKDVVVVRGSATIDGKVEGDLVVVAGSATVNGEIQGDLVVVLGSAKLGPKATVQRNATVVGGILDDDPEAKIGGDRVEFNDDTVPGLNRLAEWVNHGMMLARPLPPRLSWVWGFAGALFLINVLLSLMFPRPIHAIIEQVEKSPIAAFVNGLLMLILFAPLLILLAFTIVGAPLFLLVMMVAFLFGKVAVYCYAGRQIIRPLSASLVQSLLFTLLAGTLLFYLLYMVPVVGFMAWGAVGVWGLGAVLMAVVGSFRREKEKANPPAVASGVGTTMALGTTEQGSLPPAIGADASLPRVGFGLRFVATFLDLILVGTISAWMHLPPLFLALWGIYHIAMWTWRGTTIGGIVLGIKIVRADGRPLNFAVALIRSLSSVFSAMVLFLGFFWAGWSREKQSWHDKIAGTIVVKVPKGMSLV